MNTLILEHDQFLDANQALLQPRQYEHIKQVLKLNCGDEVRVGKINDNLGSGHFYEKDSRGFVRNIRLDIPPPSTLPLTLIVAMPRPQMLKRILQTVACFGVEKLILIQTRRVEKSFWQSPSAQDGAIREQFVLGLEQANATQLPELKMYHRFKSFIEDDCPGLTAKTDKWLLHPGPYPFLPCGSQLVPSTLAIGPEGGFTDYECERWFEQGFKAAQLGERILRVETAVTSALARLAG